jgi:hypothetical protein
MKGFNSTFPSPTTKNPPKQRHNLGFSMSFPASASHADVLSSGKFPRFFLIAEGDQPTIETD